MQLAFLCFAALTVGAALLAAFSRNMLYSLLALLACLMGVAALYALSQAPFVAVSQLVVYVGGVLVLLIYGVMFTNQQGRRGILAGFGQRLWGTLAALSLFGLLLWALHDSPLWDRPAMSAQAPAMPNPELIGEQLMTRHLLPFEVAAALLLFVLLGAAVVADRDGKPRS